MPMDTSKYGFVINGLRHVSGRECMEILKDGGLLLDVRPEYELSQLFDVDRVIYCPYDEIKEQYTDLPKDETIVIADAVGLRSKEVADFLRSKGFEHILHLSGGIVDWVRDGLPVTLDKSHRLTGSCMCQLKRRETEK